MLGLTVVDPCSLPFGFERSGERCSVRSCRVSANEADGPGAESTGRTDSGLQVFAICVEAGLPSVEGFADCHSRKEEGTDLGIV